MTDHWSLITVSGLTGSGLHEMQKGQEVHPGEQDVERKTRVGVVLVALLDDQGDRSEEEAWAYVLQANQRVC
jgi:hypothetical protein